jgi:hypothetical protein
MAQIATQKSPIVAPKSAPLPARVTKPAVVAAPKVVEAEVTPDVTKKARVAKPPIARLFQRVTYGLRVLRTSAKKSALLPTEGQSDETAVAISTLATNLADAVVQLDSANDILARLQESGYAPERFNRGSGSGGGSKGVQRSKFVAGDAIELGNKVRPAYAEYMTDEELGKLQVQKITESGRVIVSVSGTNRVVGVFRHNMLRRVAE